MIQQQIIPDIDETNWISYYDSLSKRVNFEFEREITADTVTVYRISADCNAKEEYDPRTNEFEFRGWYSIAWHRDYYFDIDSKNSNKHESTHDNRIFNFVWISIKYQDHKELNKIKLKLKRKMDKIMKADQKYYGPEYQTTTKPGDVDYTKSAEILEEEIRGIKA